MKAAGGKHAVTEGPDGELSGLRKEGKIIKNNNILERKFKSHRESTQTCVKGEKKHQETRKEIKSCLREEVTGVPLGTMPESLQSNFTALCQPS